MPRAGVSGSLQAAAQYRRPAWRRAVLHLSRRLLLGLQRSLAGRPCLLRTAAHDVALTRVGQTAPIHLRLLVELKRADSQGSWVQYEHRCWISSLTFLSKTTVTARLISLTHAIEIPFCVFQKEEEEGGQLNLVYTSSYLHSP